MESSFDRVLRLAQKTGDKLIIFDRQADKHHVLLPIEDYEELLDLNYSDSASEYDEQDFEENNHYSPESHSQNQGLSFSDSEHTSWHSTGSVLGGMRLDSEAANDLPSFDSLSEDPDIHFFSEEEEPTKESKSPAFLAPDISDSAPGFSPSEPSKNLVPPSSRVEPQVPGFQEESLDDEEPIFFEEPVE